MQGLAQVRALVAKAKALLRALTPQERLMLVGGSAILVTFLTFLAIFHDAILHWMVGVSVRFRTVPLGWLILVVLIGIISFPPLIGYSVVSMFTGMVYGFPFGWPVLAAGTVFGSFASYMAFRYLLKDRAQALAASNTKFMAFTKTLEQDNITLLWLIRLCPLPYSLSNAALASVPSVQPWRFFAATALTTPKLFLHIFIGDRVARLGSASDRQTKLVNLFSIVLALGTGVLASWIIYKRTTQRAEELERAGSYNQVGMDDFEIEDEPEHEQEQSERDPFPLADRA